MFPLIRNEFFFHNFFSIRFIRVSVERLKRLTYKFETILIWYEKHINNILVDILLCYTRNINDIIQNLIDCHFTFDFENRGHKLNVLWHESNTVFFFSLALCIYITISASLIIKDITTVLVCICITLCVYTKFCNIRERRRWVLYWNAVNK